MEERIEALEPGSRAAVRALLVLVLTDDIRVYLGNHDKKALEQAWVALETVLPGILHYYRGMRLKLDGWDNLTVGLDGRIWASDYMLRMSEVIGEFDRGTNELSWFNTHKAAGHGHKGEE